MGGLGTEIAKLAWERHQIVIRMIKRRELTDPWGIADLRDELKNHDNVIWTAGLAVSKDATLLDQMNAHIVNSAAPAICLEAWCNNPYLSHRRWITVGSISQDSFSRNSGLSYSASKSSGTAANLHARHILDGNQGGRCCEVRPGLMNTPMAEKINSSEKLDPRAVAGFILDIYQDPKPWKPVYRITPKEGMKK